MNGWIGGKENSEFEDCRYEWRWWYSLFVFWIIVLLRYRFSWVILLEKCMYYLEGDIGRNGWMGVWPGSIVTAANQMFPGLAPILHTNGRE